ncbi:MAG TPA: mandelate racemase [Albitalea sp.]|uniref:mandelate racemase n=1 Tax=Piscinibacter sp. TaxID=1903157 RepID=UPI002ED42848
MAEPMQLVVREVEAGVRPVRLRMPFRFGAVTLRACPQLFVRATVEVAGRGSATGMAAELMVPKWFDKRAAHSHADNIAHLAASVRLAMAAYLHDTPASPFGLFARHAGGLRLAGAQQGFTDLTAAYGQAVLDRAVLDAFCRALDLSFFDVATRNLLGMSDSELIGDLHGFDWSRWLAACKPLRGIHARHTIGMLDELEAGPPAADGLPTTLPAVIHRYGNRFFKIKLGGQPAADAQRLEQVLDVLDRLAPGHRYSLDGNEQYADAAALGELFVRIAGLAASARRPEALLYIEQPVPRELSLGEPLPARAPPAPLLLDEADGTLDAFPRGRALGWRGVSSKGCKGLYKALVNRARCDRWNEDERRDGRPPAWFMSAEDLTCQAGLAVQQDLAIASLLGLAHAERNGHHYADGFGDAPALEQRAFVSAHPDLYEAGAPRLAVKQGRIAIDSLFQPGFGHRADPDWRAMQPLARATTMV